MTSTLMIRQAARLQTGVRLPSATFQMLNSSKVKKNQVAFKVPMQFNKVMIKNYLEELYKVQVNHVATMIFLGKEKNLMISRKRFTKYKRPDWKKAVVTVNGTFRFPLLEDVRQLKPGGVLPGQSDVPPPREEVVRDPPYVTKSGHAPKAPKLHATSLYFGQPRGESGKKNEARKRRRKAERAKAKLQAETPATVSTDANL